MIKNKEEMIDNPFQIVDQIQIIDDRVAVFGNFVRMFVSESATT